MQIQLTRPLVFFDLETTGVDAKTARIIGISVAKHLPDGTVESKIRRYNPGMPIPAEATEVHGITHADVAHEPEFKLLTPSLSACLADCSLLV
jgi:DNA polymerase-3 subunit epsilon